jgi:hypothetical protein
VRLRLRLMWNPRRGGTRRAKFSYRRVFSFFFLYRFFEVVLRQTAGLVWTWLYLRVFSGPLCPFRAYWNWNGPCLVRDIWISIIESTNLSCFGNKLVHWPRSTLSEVVVGFLNTMRLHSPGPRRKESNLALRITLHLNGTPAKPFDPPSQIHHKQASGLWCKSLVCVVNCKAPSGF